MCGICGTFNYGNRAPAEERTVKAMAAAMIHRGPDDYGFHVDREAALGMRRLSIIDLAGGAQPISNEHGSIWVVSNGEIYNFRELRRELEAHGHVFATRSDPAKSTKVKYETIFFSIAFVVASDSPELSSAEAGRLARNDSGRTGCGSR